MNTTDKALRDAREALEDAALGLHRAYCDTTLVREAIASIDAALANQAELPAGWRFLRHADVVGGKESPFIAIWGPTPASGESSRTNDAVYRSQNRDLYDLLGRLADHQSANVAHQAEHTEAGEAVAPKPVTGLLAEKVSAYQTNNGFNFSLDGGLSWFRTWRLDGVPNGPVSLFAGATPSPSQADPEGEQK